MRPGLEAMSVPGWDLQRSNQISVPAEYGRIIAWWMVGIVDGGMFVPGVLATSADGPICGEGKNPMDSAPPAHI
jgi:hypothetical protein